MKKNKCNDFYGEPLTIGDKVLSVYPESILSSTISIIKEITYLETTKQSFLTITDEQGNILLKNVNSIYYSTEERIKKYHNDYIYCLSFVNKEGKIICNKPLTNQINPDFEIPENTLWIDLKINKLLNKERYERYSLFSFITINDLLTNFKKQNGKYSIQTHSFTYYPGFSEKSLVIFETKEELLIFINKLIHFFHENNQGQYNDYKNFEENKEAHVLSRKLTKFLETKIRIEKD